MPDLHTDTIYALSSGAGRAGVAVVRVSGAGAKSVVEALCGALPTPRLAKFCTLYSPGDGAVIDEAIVLWMSAPNSFTGEDVAEFQVHGGRAVVSRLLAVLETFDGCRIASAGEFTGRAFYNGKMDLVAVEGLADLIAAETEEQRRQAVFQQSGGASARYSDLGERLTKVLAYTEAAIDFVDEEGVEESALKNVVQSLTGIKGDLAAMLDDQHRGERLRDGVRVVIAGAPNVGKSRLLNALARRDAAIVSPIEGTTRDAIEVAIDIAGVPVVFVDTAGLRTNSQDQIELLGMARTRQHIGEADLTIWVEAPDVEPAAESRFDSETLRILNKADLLTEPKDQPAYDLSMSALNQADIEVLVTKLAEMVKKRYHGDEPALITRHRHRVAVQNCLNSVTEALGAIDQPLELVAENIRLAVREIGRIVGRVDVEDLLDVIFQDFCVGK